MRALVVAALCGGLSACLPSAGGGGPDYLGIETKLLDEDLVNIVARLGRGTQADVAEYARCAAAQYTLIRGFGFARHVRTSVGSEAGVRIADAVYTISPALPRGERTLDAEVIVADCRARGIPTV
ncbi:hypothetical protein DLJ49_12515 [Rhodovulum sp. 12E13]|uniref:hypothetical protein n=1 Tax=Rhodovulum sp. 12E13 TaxID=2203891 RepID=UPI000E17A607|nr:hypothetical protein DLJ49_12515 [Rhodovulum sp. 12E13]